MDKSSLPPELRAMLDGRKANLVDTDPRIVLLSQAENLQEIERIGTEEWLPLFGSDAKAPGNKFYYSALLRPSFVRKAMKTDGWDITIGNGLPGFSESYKDGKTIIKYNRFGFAAAEPIIFARDFHGMKPRQFDLLEEFRHFHNLYHDRKNDRYIFIDDRGEDDIVVEVSPGLVRAKARYVRQFMAARQLYLAIYFEHRAKAIIDVTTAKKALTARIVRKKNLSYSFGIGEFSLSDNEAFSRLIGKKLIAPTPVEQCGAWPYEQQVSPQFVDFVIGVDASGYDVLHTSDKDRLSDYFSKNAGAPHYLTPVWFRREVLRKYYDNPEKYSVEDGYLRCGGLWGLRMDNDLSEHVMAYLGDLGDLSYGEQLYWKSFNVTPVAGRSSDTNFKRSYLAEPTDPTSPDLLLKQQLVSLQEAWEHKFGWQLFRQLEGDDAHVIKQLRVPLSDSPAEFDHQILLLTKLLVDSLDDANLVKEGGPAAKDEKSIAKFARFLATKGYPHKDRDIKLLRSLQTVRSTGAAHRKGEQFQKIKTELQLGERTVPEVFRELLIRANDMLNDLQAHFVPDAV